MRAGPVKQQPTARSVCRATTFPYSYSGSLDGVLLHPYTFPCGYYTNFGLVRIVNLNTWIGALPRLSPLHGDTHEIELCGTGLHGGT